MATDGGAAAAADTAFGGVGGARRRRKGEPLPQDEFDVDAILARLPE